MTFIKLTSEESDLLSALMLEQAAHCFIHAQRPLPRKYAFHMTLAGHRYSKAGQRAHSLRSYKQAFQVSWLMEISCHSLGNLFCADSVILF